MEVRTMRSDERDAVLDLLDAWELPDGWRGRDFFARYMDDDPTFRCENVWLAADGDTLHACVQIFPRRMRVLGHAVPTGGIGSVYTRPQSRGSGVATALLDAAVADMLERGHELSLLFAQRLHFYGKRGWKSCTNQRTVLRLVDDAAAGRKAEAPRGFEIDDFDRERDFDAVKAIHSAYSAQRSGTLVRDDALWEASLEIAGNPGEEFRVARRHGRVIAYVRAALLFEVFTVTELARLEEGAGALAALIRSLLTPRSPDPIAPAGKSSEELRAFALLPSFDDIPLTVALEDGNVTAHPMEDPSTMIRCLNASALASRLDVSLFPNEDGAQFLDRILPADGLVFWPADRF